MEIFRNFTGKIYTNYERDETASIMYNDYTYPKEETTMKKVSILLVLCLLLSGCGAQESATAPVTEPSTQAATVPSTQAATVPPTTQPPTTAAPVFTLSVYIPNENADGWDILPQELPELDANLIVAALIDNHVLNGDISLNTYETVGDTVNLDFNEAFLNQLQTYGTAGERMMIGSVVNTFLSVWDAKAVYITVDGEIMESGHVIYDFPMEYQE